MLPFMAQGAAQGLEDGMAGGSTDFALKAVEWIYSHDARHPEPAAARF